MFVSAIINKTMVFNAGISEFSTLGTITPDHFDRAFGLNVRSLLFATQEAIDLMPDGGAVVLIGSIAGMIGTHPFAASASLSGIPSANS